MLDVKAKTKLTSLRQSVKLVLENICSKNMFGRCYIYRGWENAVPYLNRLYNYLDNT